MTTELTGVFAMLLFFVSVFGYPVIAGFVGKGGPRG